MSARPSCQPADFNLWRLVLSVGIAALMLLTPLPAWGRVAQAAGDALHAPLFAVLAMIVWRFATGRLRRSTLTTGLLVWCGVSAFGLVTETLQMWVGRHPSWSDVFANVLGAAAGTLWASRHGISRRPFRIAVCTTGAALIVLASRPPVAILVDVYRQHAEMPLVGSFESPMELSRWIATECRISRSRNRSTDGDWSLRLDLTTETYTGAALRWPLPDWTAYRSLYFDLYLNETDVAGHPPLVLIVKLEDAHHNNNPDDRFHRTVRLSSGWNRVRIRLSDVVSLPNGRKFDLSRVAFLQFFTVRPSHPQTIYLDNIHLR